MFRLHFMISDHYEVSSEDRRAVEAIVGAADARIRTHLPQLPTAMNLLFEPGKGVIEGAGFGAYAMSPNLIKWTYDYDARLVDVATAHLEASLFHECHHSARLVKFPGEAYTIDWPHGAVFEGMATVFERDQAGASPPWGEYDAAVIEAWAQELFRQPVDHTYNDWKFDHPDGRRWIAYRVGTWVVDRAIARTGRGAAEMVWDTIPDILRDAEFPSA